MSEDLGAETTGSVSLSPAELSPAEPIPAVGSPSDLQQLLLRLLADGLTDDAAASRLGISPRTTRRHVAKLMDALGATSRFQAGARAVSIGWLTGGESHHGRPHGRNNPKARRKVAPAVSPPTAEPATGSGTS